MSKKEEVKLSFLNRIKEGKSLKYSIFKEEDKLLLFRVERHFGSISKCAEECGISKEDLISKHGMTNRVNNKILSDEEILERLNYLKSINKLNTNNMRLQFDDLKLEYSLKRKYGSVKNALSTLGYKRSNETISFNKAVLKLRELNDNKVPITYNYISKNHHDIYYVIRNELNMNWHDCLIHLNIDYEIKKVIKYTKEHVRDKLIEIENKEGAISYSILREKYSGILSYVRRNYNDISDFYIDFGYDPSLIMDYNSQISKGISFEKIFKEILDLLGIDYTYNKYIANNTLRPDFILKDGTIIDCKLSSWTDSIESTYDKYKEHSPFVEVVYLRGLNEYCDLNESNFKLTNVMDYVYKINPSDRNPIIDKLNEITKLPTL